MKKLVKKQAKQQNRMEIGWGGSNGVDHILASSSRFSFSDNFVACLMIKDKWESGEHYTVISDK